MRLAIVGSTEFVIPDALGYAESVIRGHLKVYKPELVISGGAKGVDSLAVTIADELRIPYTEYLPFEPRWSPNGYRERNMKIAEECTAILRIICHTSKTYGSGWTRDRAVELGKANLGTYVL
jgi:hypothetical protein